MGCNITAQHCAHCMAEGKKGAAVREDQTAGQTYSTENSKSFIHVTSFIHVDHVQQHQAVGCTSGQLLALFLNVKALS